VLIDFVPARSYTENFVTDGEFAALPPRLQEHIKRAAAHREAQGGGWNMYYSPAPATNRFRRVGKLYFTPPGKLNAVLTHTA
jgi:hypothetical protein